MSYVSSCLTLFLFKPTWDELCFLFPTSNSFYVTFLFLLPPMPPPPPILPPPNPLTPSASLFNSTPIRTYGGTGDRVISVLRQELWFVFSFLICFNSVFWRLTWLLVSGSIAGSATQLSSFYWLLFLYIRQFCSQLVSMQHLRKKLEVSIVLWLVEHDQPDEIKDLLLTTSIL